MNLYQLSPRDIKLSFPHYRYPLISERLSYATLLWLFSKKTFIGFFFVKAKLLFRFLLVSESRY